MSIFVEEFRMILQGHQVVLCLYASLESVQGDKKSKKVGHKLNLDFV